jgi:phage recombination protein Bet
MENQIVKYLATGGNIELSPEIIKAQLVPPDSKITDQELGFFLQLCKYQKLNPFLKEIHIVKYGSHPAAFVVGKETFLRRAKRDAKYLGHTVAISDDGKLAWAEVDVKGLKQPIRCEVELQEYIGTKADGTVNSMWSKKPKTMLKKVALVQALREAFPDSLAQLYDESEVDKEGELLEVQANVVQEAETKTDPKLSGEKTSGSTPPVAKKSGDSKPSKTTGEAMAVITKIKNVTQTKKEAWSGPRYNIEAVGGTIYTTFIKKYADDASEIKGTEVEVELGFVVVTQSGKEYFNLLDKKGLAVL